MKSHHKLGAYLEKATAEERAHRVGAFGLDFASVDGTRLHLELDLEQSTSFQVYTRVRGYIYGTTLTSTRGRSRSLYLLSEPYVV